MILPDMLRKAPFFNRIKLWRKYKGHAVFGGGSVIPGAIRGQGAAIIKKSQERRQQIAGPPRGPAMGMAMPPRSYPGMQMGVPRPMMPPPGGSAPGYYPGRR